MALAKAIMTFKSIQIFEYSTSIQHPFLNDTAGTVDSVFLQHSTLIEVSSTYLSIYLALAAKVIIFSISFSQALASHLMMPEMRKRVNMRSEP